MIKCQFKLTEDLKQDAKKILFTLFQRNHYLTWKENEETHTQEAMKYGKEASAFLTTDWQ